MSGFIDSVLSSVPAWVVYVAVFGFPFLEAAVLLGFVLPGEAAVVFGGVLAGRGGVSLTLVLVLAIAGAVLGDSVGYLVGRRYGETIQQTRWAARSATSGGARPRTSCAAAARSRSSSGASPRCCGRWCPGRQGWRGCTTGSSSSSTSSAVSCGPRPA